MTVTAGVWPYVGGKPSVVKAHADARWDAQVELARATPGGLALATSHAFQLPPHLDLIDRRFVDLAARIVTRADPEGHGHGPRLMIFMPPRHGKSLLTSQYGPAWFLGTFPDRRVVVSSYGEGLAVGWARRARDLLEEKGPELFGVRVRRDTKAASLWELEPGGGMMAVGVGSALTGRGADLLIIDDPLKDAKEAQSALIRDRAWDWWETTARTRLMPGGGVILIMTRWHEDDLAGRLLKAEADGHGDRWDVLSLPALAEAGCTATFEGGVRDLGPDPLGREPGDALWPAQYDRPNLEQTREGSSTYWFAAMYQQRPTPEEGGLLKARHFRYWRGYQDDAPHQVRTVLVERDEGPRPVDLEYCLKFQTVDTAATERETSDFTVCSTWAVTPDGDLLLLHRERHRMEAPDQPPLLIREYRRWRPAVVGLERKNTGIATYQELVRAGLPMRELVADTDKQTRAISAGARLEEHRVFWPSEAGWLKEWERECAHFPNAAHDDQVDTLAYACLMLPDLAARSHRQAPARRPVSAGLQAGDV